MFTSPYIPDLDRTRKYRVLIVIRICFEVLRKKTVMKNVANSLEKEHHKISSFWAETPLNKDPSTGVFQCILQFSSENAQCKIINNMGGFVSGQYVPIYRKNVEIYCP